MKYIIDIPSSQEYSYDKDFKSLDLKFHDDNFSGMTRFDAEPYIEPDREDIEDEVWSFAWKISSMDIGEYAEIFDDEGYSSDYREAKSKYEAWLKKKDEIRVGDEVTRDDALSNGFVTRIDEYKDANVVWEMGGTGCVNAALLKKTGRHFPEVAELLEKMRGDSDEVN